MPRHLLIAAACSALALPVAAVAAPKPELDATVGAATDYVFRGVSQTEGKPEVFGSLDLSLGGAYAGVSAENVRFAGDADTRAELDLYGGVRRAIGGWSFDLGAAWYSYPDAPKALDYDYLEFKLAASRSFGKTTLGAAVAHAPRYFGDSGAASYGEVNLGYAVSPSVSLSGAVGYQDVGYDGDYATWNAGVTWTLADRLALDLRYSDTDGHRYGDAYDRRVAAILRKTF